MNMSDLGIKKNRTGLDCVSIFDWEEFRSRDVNSGATLVPLRLGNCEGFDRVR